MRIVVVADWFSEKMGYSENCLPKALASLGHEVHLVTTEAQVYYNQPTYRATYEPFIGPPIVPRVVKAHDGYTLHRLPIGGNHKLWRSGRYIKHLFRTLAVLRPEIVQALDVDCQSTRDLALAKPLLRYRLFLEAHTHASVFSPGPKSKKLLGKARTRIVGALGRLASRASVKCYAISADAAAIAVDHLGMASDKVEVMSLGVDTDLFRPATDGSAQQARRQLRGRLGFADSDIVCVYTGRLSSDKGPLLLAQAVDQLAKQGLPYRGLFVGSGPQADIESIKSCQGCRVSAFVPFRDLPPYYQVADIGVWPKQESTSQLDAAACGLPIIISDRTDVPERIDGNGLTYNEPDAADLAAKLLSLRDPELRRRMGAIGSARIRERFSWTVLARKRIEDYATSLRSSAGRD